MWWYFYVLQSQRNSNWFYKGSTNDFNKRIQQHNDGLVQSTKAYRPLRPVYFEAYLSKRAAMDREYSVKKSGSVWTPLMRRIKNSLEKDKDLKNPA